MGMVRSARSSRKARVGAAARSEASMGVSTSPGQTARMRIPSRVVERHGARQVVHRALGRAVGGHARRADVAPDRAEVDDHAALLRDHGRQRRPAHEEDAVHVDAKDLAPRLVAGVDDVGALDDARGVDQCVDTAKAGDDRRDGLVAEGRLADIAGVELGGAAVIDNCLCRARGVAIDDDDLRAAPANSRVVARAHARHATGLDDDLPGKVLARTLHDQRS